MHPRYYLLTCLTVLGCVSAASAQDVPEWLRRAANQSIPSYSSETPAVVLSDDERLTINSDGVTLTNKTFALRVLKRDGRSLAVARDVYLTDSGRIKEFRGWLLRSSGEVLKYSGKHVLDIAAVRDDVYNEVRVKVLSASSDVDVGDVFGYEVISEDKSIFLQHDYAFQERLPVITSSYSLTLPQGWRVESFTFNHPRIEPTVTGTTSIWEIKNLSYIKDEPAMPDVSALVPRLAVTVFPDKPLPQIPTFGDWRAVSSFIGTLHAPQMEPGPALLEKSRQLGGTTGNEMDRIRAIARYVQDIKYLSIQTGVGRGGGYRPHSAAEVATKGWGDCKDKANLMRAMLKLIGITAFPVAIYSGDRTYVREEWPSPQQFNHCIIAIKVSDEVNAPAVMTHPTLGRLLLFDPTDPHTPLGNLPDHEQLSLALVVAGEDGALVRTPAPLPETSNLERNISATLSEIGAISVSLSEKASGNSAVALLKEWAQLSKDDYSKRIESWVARAVAGARITKVEPSAAKDLDRFALDVEFSSDQYAKNPQQRLMLFSPVYVAKYGLRGFTDESRKYPLVLEAQSYTETGSTKLPAGYRVDEIPEGVKLEEPFGSYKANFEAKDGILIFNRSLLVRASTLKPEDYSKVRAFFRKIRETEDAMVVLVRK